MKKIFVNKNQQIFKGLPCYLSTVLGPDPRKGKRKSSVKGSKQRKSLQQKLSIEESFGHLLKPTTKAPE